ncbi:UDP-N-acetyl-D-mannosamine dehydrogenase [Desulfoscipio geothermicus]|jgi:UDP-N-acetyl-D-mannosaminuronic acid dehydrogenase|uniref:UDP-N-acetyl-D-mannosaminuronic acid dehydrogenase n=1 Tax=Desulfoscipio geothermicus DSM 3669 TaxID=1121426 RepID=A0A1I6CZS0_9FIRM|nr:UDP-N-acetyl-D-mannosamine dehydrogenase [Desulfoscipio geothermicus]SFQ98631.1 UDP-N-acetyl-D-mannosaminuronic acid dehydrogenase [Desulfoscipio geothermicus DSM 3669]
MEKVCVLGLGYIGLPTASLLATKGFKVHGVDVNTKTVEAINRGSNHIHEPDLDVLVKSAVLSGNLVAALEPAPAEIFIIAVPTPLKEKQFPDISYIQTATHAIAPYLEPGNLVILESTSPVGTTEKITGWLKELRPDLLIPPVNEHIAPVASEGAQIFITHCPERVLPGQIIKELIDNDRIIGGIDQASAQKAELFYRKFIKGNILLTDARTAELCKLVENAFRDVNIAFANELSVICDNLGINVWELIDLANRHPRVNILMPGPGVGGHCIAVDPWFIVHAAPGEARIIRAARKVNDSKPRYVAAKVAEKAARFKEPVIACLGLAFKADINDLRESPAVEIVQQLAVNRTGRILVVEPHIDALPAELVDLENVHLADLGMALRQADLVTLLVNHRAFYSISRELLNEKVIIDTRGIWR